MNVTTMQQFRVTISDKTTWTTTVEATGTNEAEDLAWQLFESSDRSEHFEDDSDTTVQVEEVVS